MHATKAIKGPRSEEAKTVITSELQQMVIKGVWHGVKMSDYDAAERRAILSCTQTSAPTV